MLFNIFTNDFDKEGRKIVIKSADKSQFRLDVRKTFQSIKATTQEHFV